MVNIQPASNEFRGFDEARTLLSCHESRARTLAGIEQTSFLHDDAVAAVHVENTSRADRAFLTAYDRSGAMLRADIFFIDYASQRLDVTVEFDHDFTGMAVAQGSELEQAIRREDGWVINMDALRDYDLLDDRRITQRAVLLAHLGDMMASGQAKGFLLGKHNEADGGDDVEGDAA